MSRANMSRRSGFTLVEMVIIAPIALLVITGFIALMVTMVGDVIASRSRNVMTYDIQSALNAIERDVRLSTEFLATSGTLPSPQGKNGATSAFESTAGDLILGEIATNKNPVDPTRSFIYYNSPFSCSDPTQVYQNRIFFITVMYTVRDNSLWRRTYVPTASGLCQPQWQVNTCAPGYASSQTQCQATDSEILKNVKDFRVNYYVNPEDTVTLPLVAAPSASTIGVTIEAEQTSAGRTITASSTGRSTKLSSREINLAPPAAPTVSGSNSGRDAVFSWPSVPTATAYIIKYNINGGSWVTATENTTETTFSLPANHGDTVSVKVNARNTTGASPDANASAAIPMWIDCGLMDGWVNYSPTGAPSHEQCGFTITKHGVVVLKGLIKDGPAGNSKLFNLPEGYRSNQRLIFNAAGSSGTVRINVDSNGDVLLSRETGDTTSSGYISLDGIIFIPGRSSYTRSMLTLQNGWTNYGSIHPALQSITDSSGRIHVQGLIVPGTITSGTVIATIPNGTGTSHRLFTVRSHGGGRPNGVAHAAIYNSANLIARGSAAGTYFSVQQMYHPSTYTGWQNFATAVPGTPADSQLGNGWVNYSSTWGPPSYTKAPDGIVSLRGLIGSGNTASGTIVARLPSGYRPRGYLLFQTAMYNDTWSRIDVDSNGYVRVYRSNASWTSLDGISFVADGS